MNDCTCKPGVPACMSCLRETFPVSRNDMLNARAFAEEAHGDQKYNNLPYTEEHLDKVVDEILNFTSDPVYIAVGYLHDVLEDTNLEYDDVADQFGFTIADAVFDLTDGDGETRFERQLFTYARCRDNAISRLVKLCDRTVNMRASFKTKHAFTYVNEYERFKGSLLVIDCNRCQWIELDRLYNELKNDIGLYKEHYLRLLPSGEPQYLGDE